MSFRITVFWYLTRRLKRHAWPVNNSSKATSALLLEWAAQARPSQKINWNCIYHLTSIYTTLRLQVSRVDPRCRLGIARTTTQRCLGPIHGARIVRNPNKWRAFEIEQSREFHLVRACPARGTEVVMYCRSYQWVGRQYTLLDPVERFRIWSMRTIRAENLFFIGFINGAIN